MTDDERSEYEEKIAGIVQIITTDGAEARNLFTSADILAREMLPEQPSNINVLTAVKGAHLVFTVAELKSAMARHFKAMAQRAQEEVKAQQRAALLGLDPSTEREFISGFMAARGYDVDFHRRFFGADGKTKKLKDIENDARLTAGDLHLIKPRGELLSVAEIKAALVEWATERRQQRKDLVAAHVLQEYEGDHEALNDSFSDVCFWYFQEPLFAEAVCRKFIWSVKRRLLRLKIKHVMMTCLVGPQDTGKTAMAQMLYSPVDELATEVSLADLLDTRQMDMPEYYVAFTDEMAFAERAHVGQFKTFLNGSSPSRRPMGTNFSERIEVNCTVIGTANHSLDKVVYDSSGMRRFVEIMPRARIEIEPHWDDIVAFNWTALWRSIDPYAEDPLVSKFRKELMAKQEAIRNLDNAELWLRTFNPLHHADTRRRETSCPEWYEWWAEDLYRAFRTWEEEFDPRHDTALQRWGKDMRSLIENGHADGWSRRTASNKTVYRYVLPVHGTNAVVPLVGIRSKR